MSLVSFTAFLLVILIDCNVLDGSDDKQHIADYTIGWRSVLAQKTVLVCFKAGSDEIVGVNFNFVNSVEDDFFKHYTDLLSVIDAIARCFNIEFIFNTNFHFQCDSVITKMVFGMISLLYENFDPFERYGVTEFLGSFGLSVDRKYRGRGVGQQLLGARCVKYYIAVHFPD